MDFRSENSLDFLVIYIFDGIPWSGSENLYLMRCNVLWIIGWILDLRIYI